MKLETDAVMRYERRNGLAWRVGAPIVENDPDVGAILALWSEYMREGRWLGRPFQWPR